MNTWHLKPKSCQWSKNVNAERSRHYSDSNPLCSEYKTTLQGLSTVHLECTAYVTRDREKLELRETGVMWWLLILLTPSTSLLTNKNSPCGWESFENKISEVCDRFAKESIVRKFGSIHTSNYIGVKKIWLNESSLHWCCKASCSRAPTSFMRAIKLSERINSLSVWKM